MIAVIRREGYRRATAHRVAGAASLAVLLSLIAIGCGSDGTISVTKPPQDPPIAGRITGTVYAPNGQIARVDRVWDWLTPFELVSKAYAALNPNVEPVGPAALVSLTRIDEADASDGEVKGSLITNVITNVDGMYEIVDSELDELDLCRLMVAVGGNELLNRAFVVSGVTNIDVASEATVHVVLNRLTLAPPAHLCDFSTAELISLQDIVANATFTAVGENVSEINQDAYRLARTDICVHDALQKATDSDLDGTPTSCLRFYPQ